MEELTRKRRSDDAERFVEMFRRSTVDPNPHQIEAAMFALQRLPSGGAMLCDEVGLGKTIEAGLVITQLRAEGKAHVLIIVPLSLGRQWQVELQELFSLRSTIVGADSLGQSNDSKQRSTEPDDEQSRRGIYIIGREFASTSKGKAWLQSKGAWDLVVIDEAHEMFSTIHTRFSKSNGDYQKNLSKGGARRAAQVKSLIEGAPILLLSATPLQNNLYELWGLLQFVDPEYRILGRFNEFCTLFVTGEGGRTVMPDMEETLRRRLSLVLKRTLRRQAQPFMKQPFRARHVHTANFSSEKMEAELHRAINQWLSQDMLAAYRKGHRALMALQVRRRMASSIEALVATLGTIKERMLEIRKTGKYPGRDSFDLELENISDDNFDDGGARVKRARGGGVHGDPDQPRESVDMQLLEDDITEIERIEKLAQEVMRAGGDGKKRRLLDVIRQIESRSIKGLEDEQTVSDKVVIFTESVRTMESLRDYLEANGFKDHVTTFSGTKEGPIADRALARWQEEVGKFLSPALESGAAIRGALIHEFKTRTRILIATEAGAKGLNLQFCNCLINYDLPWNPQRIEQRIGRVHRYGQKHDVLIVNFINLSNEAEARVYELLEEKLHVFTETLGASDTIINQPEVALNLEVRINEILDRCRTQEQIREEFDKLSLELDEVQRQMHDEKLRATKLLLQDLDTSVQARLRKLEGELESALSRCDEILLGILRAEGGLEIVGSNGPRTLIMWNGRLCHLGPPEPGAECGEPIHRDHPDVQEVIARCLAATDGLVLTPNTSANDTRVLASNSSANEAPISTASSTQFEVYRLLLLGLEEEEIILIVGSPASASTSESESEFRNIFDTVKCNFANTLESGIELFKTQAERRQREYVDRLLSQIASRRADLQLCADASMAELQKKLEQAERARRLANSPAASAKAQSLQKRILTEIEKTRQETAAETAIRLREFDDHERKIRLLQFIEVTPKLLFSVKKSPLLVADNA